jgi:spore coat protein A, manganese oxidase
MEPALNPTRRQLLWLAATGVGCSNGRPEAKLVRSRIALPKPFMVSLPIPQVLSGRESYDVPVRSDSARILPDVTTEIWGYGGTFPGPVIEARSGVPLRLRLRNELPVPIVNHLHGGRTPASSDGYPSDLVQPGETREYIYPNQQRAATLWYHDHRMDHTAQQVWRGLAGMYILRDDAEQRLPLPCGDKEIPLLICDRSFDSDGALLYPAGRHEYRGGVLGDVVLVNGAPWPKLSVANTKYRFRILNASNARRYELGLDHPFLQIGSDGGLLAAPVRLSTIRIAPGERFDIIVDFSRYPLDSAVTMTDNGAPVMQFQVTRRERDESWIPARLSEIAPAAVPASAAVRVFDFAYQRRSGSWTINGKPFDPNRMDAQPKLGSTEIWQLQTDFSHPLHLHLVHFRVLSHSGRPGLFDSGYKDTIDLAPGQIARILIRFDGYKGRYVFHCHNLEHEDMAMMGNFEVI